MAQIFSIYVAGNQICSIALMEKGTFILSQMTAICSVHVAFAENKTCPARYSFTFIRTVKDIIYFVFF